MYRVSRGAPARGSLEGRITVDHTFFLKPEQIRDEGQRRAGIRAFVRGMTEKGYVAMAGDGKEWFMVPAGQSCTAVREDATAVALRVQELLDGGMTDAPFMEGRRRR